MQQPSPSPLAAQPSTDPPHFNHASTEAPHFVKPSGLGSATSGGLFGGLGMRASTVQPRSTPASQGERIGSKRRLTMVGVWDAGARSTGMPFGIVRIECAAMCIMHDVGGKGVPGKVGGGASGRVVERRQGRAVAAAANKEGGGGSCKAKGGWEGSHLPTTFIHTCPHFKLPYPPHTQCFSAPPLPPWAPPTSPTRPSGTS